MRTSDSTIEINVCFRCDTIGPRNRNQPLDRVHAMLMSASYPRSPDLCKPAFASATGKGRATDQLTMGLIDNPHENKPVDISAVTTPVATSFSVEAIVAALSKLDTEQPLQPVVDNIKADNIRSVCLFAGCNNVKVPRDKNFTIMAIGDPRTQPKEIFVRQDRCMRCHPYQWHYGHLPNMHDIK